MSEWKWYFLFIVLPESTGKPYHCLVNVILLAVYVPRLLDQLRKT